LQDSKTVPLKKRENGYCLDEIRSEASPDKTAILGRMNLKVGVACIGIDAKAHCRCVPEKDLF